MSEISVRKACADEFGRILELKKQIHQLHVQGRPDLFAPMQSFEAYQAHALDKNMQLFVAEQAEKLLGYALVCYINRPGGPYMCERNYVHVEEFCVDERFQRMGAGSALMDAIRTDARENGYPRIELDVWAFNEGARQFYEAVGMKCFRYFMEMDTQSPPANQQK